MKIITTNYNDNLFWAETSETMKEVASIEQKKNELVMEALNDKSV